MPFQANPRRDAHATIAGLFYQVNVTILRWLNLQPGQHLELESGEDIDTVDTAGNEPSSAERRLLEQLKVRSKRSLTLRSPEALEALSNFCEHRASNPGSFLKFRYLTTASAGVEQSWTLPESGIDTWIELHHGRYSDELRAEALAEIRKALILGMQPKRASEKAWKALQQLLQGDNDALGELIFSFEWALGRGDPNQSEADVLSTLVSQGHASSSADTVPVYTHLFAFVFRLLTKPGPKVLTIDALDAELASPSIPPNQRGILDEIKGEIEALKKDVGSIKRRLDLQNTEVNVLKQTVEMIGKSYGFENVFALSAATLSTDVPELVSPRANRRVIIDSLLARVEADGVVVLIGEPGSGKTQLLRLLTDKASRGTIWLNIPRISTEAQANLLIDSLIRYLAPKAKGTSLRDRYTAAMSAFAGSVVVIEDLPRILPGGPLAAQLETLASCLKSAQSTLFLSSYYALPASLRKSLGNVAFDVPRFTEKDAEEVLRSAGAPESFPIEAIARMLITLSQGLPVLVMAAVRYLSDHNWAFSTTEMESLIRGEFAADHRADVGTLLQTTVPDVEERELLIRMSLAVGPFTREDVVRVAKVPKAIPLPGEKVERAKGLWFQDTGSGRFLLSPLIGSGLSTALDPKTRTGVHYVLALQILSRKLLTPIDVVTCVHHLTMAEDMAFAGIVLIQTHASILEMDDAPDDDFGLLRIYVAAVLASDIDLNLRLYLCALDVVMRLKQGREIDSMTGTMDRLLKDADYQGWGTVLASGTLAIRLVWDRPSLANRYLLLALAGAGTARLPDGSLLPVADYPLEVMLWVSGYSAKSDEDADSWLESVAHFTPNQLHVLKSSEMTEDGVTILCDGYWRREHQKSETERDWNHVAQKLDDVDRTARTISFDLLEAAAIRTRIMLLAEWQHLLDDAVALAATSLERIANDDCRFLILEVTGRQLGYAGKHEEAIDWLDRALSCTAYQNSLWRRNVLITLADLYSKTEPKKAQEFTASAVDMAKDGALIVPIYIETMLEHIIALWNAGEERKASDVFADVLLRLFAIKEDTDGWKGLFYRTFHVLSYFSDIAQHGKDSKTYTAPEQGLFLSNNDTAHTYYKQEQQSYIWIRQAMLADGVGDVQGAAFATWKAVRYAEGVPTAWADVPLPSLYGIPATLLANDFEGATRLAMTLTSAEPKEIRRRLEEKGYAERAAEFDKLQEKIPTAAQQSTMRVIPLVPMAIRLAELRLHGWTRAETESALNDIERIMPPDKQPEAFGQALRRSFLEDVDWSLLQQEGYDSMRSGQYARALSLLVGAMQRAPIIQSLYLQTYLAQNFEQWFGTARSIYRALVAPMFRAYWEHALATSTAFRTGMSYTNRQFELLDGTPGGTRKFLSAMRFCLGTSLPEDTMNWLNRS
jgi:tetratricopeptide (TPR) repeat protein/energy-coupling factor transporter ATP-binding protein EcfA2